jgi:hypothetical protein
MSAAPRNAYSRASEREEEQHPDISDFAKVRLTLSAVLRDPERQLLFLDGSTRNAEHSFDAINLGRPQAIPIYCQKQTDAAEGRPFVAVREGVAFRYAIAI